MRDESFGTILENVVYARARDPRYDEEKTKNKQRHIRSTSSPTSSFRAQDATRNVDIPVRGRVRRGCLQWRAWMKTRSATNLSGDTRQRWPAQSVASPSLSPSSAPASRRPVLVLHRSGTPTC